jgi:lysophospholipase L1-like esterase
MLTNVQGVYFPNQTQFAHFAGALLAASALAAGLGACASSATDGTTAGNVAMSGATDQPGSAGSGAGASASSSAGGPVEAGGALEAGGGSTALGGSSGIAGATGWAGAMQEGGAAGLAGSMAQGGAGAQSGIGGIGGTASSGAGSGGAGSQPYNPCPPKGKPCVVLPVGDSITAGSQSSTGGGYRLPLFDLAAKNTKSLTFVGANASGPATVDGVAFPRANSGYSGYEIDSVNGRQGISQFFPAQIAKYKPNIVLLMIGTNDVASAVPNIPPRLGALMDSILGADPALLLVVAQIVPQQRATPDTQNTLVQAYNAAIPPLVQARVAAGKHVLMVDMYRALTSNASYSTMDFANTLHPNDAGYAVMAATWYAPIGPLLR